jgi:hypothetical protein
MCRGICKAAMLYHILVLSESPYSPDSPPLTTVGGVDVTWNARDTGEPQECSPMLA